MLQSTSFHNSAFCRSKVTLGMSGTRGVPMSAQIFRGYDAFEIMMLAGSVVVIVAIAFMF